MKTLPPVKSIEGGYCDWSGEARTSTFAMQYRDTKGDLIELTMPFLDAMYLLSILKGVQLDMGFPMPDDPRKDAGPGPHGR